MSPLNIGVVGTGIFARDGHLPVFQDHPDKFKVVAAFNSTKSKALDFAKLAEFPEEKVFDDMDSLINDKDVDYVDVLLPAQFNLDAVKKCVAAGKPVQIEKPIAANMKQARELVEVAESTDLPIAISENWSFLQAINVAREHLPRIGEVVGFQHNSTGPFVLNNKYMATSWRQHPEHIGGFLSDGGVHQLALVTALVGEIESISALTSQVREASGDDDIVFSTLKIRNSKCIGSFSYGSAFGATDKWIYLKIYGVNGSIMIELNNKAAPIVRVKVGSDAEHSGEEEVYNVKEDKSFGIYEEFTNFHDAVAKKDKSLLISSPRAAFHHLACVAAFIESSAKKGDHVEVERY
ncbi:similar to Saccharomyces cerevisiae YMR315W Protein with NADP(H) oxidoreductase activity [Maudiozyma barnettii]|uniref:Similar to Saccharomyces cerevisiae YMR315W Protein with NADP(H) oxidoreductase activity n=1 Tax=Maudiozyma barnettii TaxID=61262 RepID=A0A8H2ZID8_9SACH|nr:hypothetical protein [Kazachstania barnettii]CAB4252984.1 similar to Saccharomyces cerevisiae YMR315W Protein with NADP(H) oxidoreductase activity [Kazachstania barnettii]CAD1780788.1 similar to Saccharomyces cerevisiae YMR315W Protein with NADP(H) oxidoreductase activity [Kazachstania barnettii]